MELPGAEQTDGGFISSQADRQKRMMRFNNAGGKEMMNSKPNNEQRVIDLKKEIGKDV